MKRTIFFTMFILFIFFTGVILYAEDNPNLVIPDGEMNSSSENIIDANSWITIQYIGAAPNMDVYTSSDITWQHTFDIMCKAIFDVKMTIHAYDVDFDQGERDEVFINGVSFGYLVGDTGENWTDTEIILPIQFLINAGGILDVVIKVDVFSGGWDALIDWSELRTHWDLGGKITGFVYNDADQNGQMNGNEAGISNVVLRLFNKDDAQPVTIMKGLSTSTGHYHFYNVPNGEYIIKIGENSLPEGVGATTGGEYREVTVGTCDYLTENFGYYRDFTEPFFAGQGAYQPEIPEGKEGNDLVFVSGTQTFGSGDYSWHKAVDGDYEGWDGTTLARGNEIPDGPASAIFQFADAETYKFNYVVFMTDNGTDDDGMKYDRQTQQLEVLVSTTGQAPGDFTSLGIFNRKFDGTKLEWHKLPDYVNAKYIKLCLILPNDCYEYWRQIVEFEVHDGATKMGASPAHDTSPVLAVVNATELHDAYPNPFNPQTTIEYNLNTDTNVTIHIYDVNGRLVETLVDEPQFAGSHRIVWNAVSHASGTYFVTMQAGKTVQSSKVVLLK